MLEGRDRPCQTRKSLCGKSLRQCRAGLGRNGNRGRGLSKRGAPVQTAVLFSFVSGAVTLPVLSWTIVLWILVVAGASIVVFALFRQRAPRRRARAVRDLLDAADALEARLRTARAEIEAVAGEQGPDPVGDAMREMLRQRIWLRDHGREASLEQLAEVRSSIDTARTRIDAQLIRIAQARAPLT